MMMSEEQQLPVCHTPSPHVGTLEPGKYAYCTCGLSEDGIFCNGAHRGTTFRPMVFKVTEQPEKCAICRCKKTGKAPFCDGSHRNG